MIRPEDVARFFVDRQEHDPTRSVLRLLKLRLENSVGQPRPYKGLLTGHVGCGKTCELMRLGQELAQDFLVIWLDAEATLSTEKANHFDILLAMGVSAHAAARAAGLRPDRRLVDALLKSLASFVRKYEERKGFTLRLDMLLRQVFTAALVASAGAAGGPPAALAAGAAAVGANQLLRESRIDLNVRDENVRLLELPANRQEVVGALNQLLDHVRQKAGRPVLLIVDGLDKVPPPRAHLLFAETRLLAELAAALLYTTPIEFYHRLGAGTAVQVFDEHLLLPNVAVHQRPPVGPDWRQPRQPDDAGLQVGRHVVRARLEAGGRAPEDLITPVALDVLALASGGVMRELIRSFRDAATFAQLLGLSQIDEALARDVMGRRRQEAGLRLTANHREALRDVLERLDATEPAIRAAALRALGSMELRSDELLQRLLRLGRDPDDSLRTEVARAIPDVGPQSRETMALLLELSRDKHDGVRFWAALGFARMAPVASTPQVIVALQEMLGDPFGPVQGVAARVLGNLGQGAATPEVITTLCEHAKSGHYSAAMSLARLCRFIRLDQRNDVLTLILSLWRSQNSQLRDAGYVGLCNLLLGEVGAVLQ